MRRVLEILDSLESDTFASLEFSGKNPVELARSAVSGRVSIRVPSAERHTLPLVEQLTLAAAEQADPAQSALLLGAAGMIRRLRDQLKAELEEIMKLSSPPESRAPGEESKI